MPITILPHWFVSWGPSPSPKGPLTPSLIIAVDGPAASGKGTIAARLAATYGLPHLDTGLLYRAVGVKVLDAGGSLDDEPRRSRRPGAGGRRPIWSIRSA
jgi:hypothetical protein